MAEAGQGQAWTAATRGLARGLGAALVFSFALNLLMLAVPLYSMQLFDRVLGSGHVETLVLLSLVTALALAALGGFEMVRASLLARTLARFEQRLAASAAAMATRPDGAGAACLRDLAQLRQALAGPFLATLADAPWLPLALAALWALHPLLATFTGVGALGLAALAVLNDLLTRRFQLDAARAQLDAQALAEALACKAEAAQAMGMADALVHRVARLHDASLAGQQQAAERAGIVMGVVRALRLAVQAGVMGLAAWLILAHELTPGAMLAGSILAGRALAPVEQLAGVWRAAVTARDGWGRLRRLLPAAEAPSPPTGLPAPTGRLVVETVGARAADGRVLLRNVGFALEPGECLAVLGPSGAGKSTLCRLLTGVTRPEVGAVRLDGAPLEQYPPAELGAHLGYLPQETMLFAGSVAENIARMAPRPDAAAVVEAARRAGAHEAILRLGQGYGTRLADGGAPLSGGQRRRIGLARALYGDPRLVVLDEPDAGLDGPGEAALAATLVRLKEAGTTVVVVTHRPQALHGADKMLVLENGLVTGFGPREAVLAARLRPVRAA